MSGNGVSSRKGADKELGEIVAEVSEKASLLVRREIDLAKAEVTDKLTKLGRGAAIGAAAGVFLIFGVTMLFHTLAWFLFDIFNFDAIWIGFAIVTLFLFLLAAIAALVAYRLFKKASPPMPEMAIEQAKLTRAELEGQKVERDQVGRSLAKGEELQS